MRTPLLAALLGASLLVGRAAEAHPPPPRYPRERPHLEVTSWVALGGGALTQGANTQGIFDLRLGGDFTAGVSRAEDVRIGPFAEVATATFASVQAVGGVELFVGAVPRPLRMFLYPGEGTFVLRAGAGYAWRNELPGAPGSPVASLTVAYGYRAPFSLREPSDELTDKPYERRTARYMVGVRFWVGAVVDLAGDPAWQLSGGLEFEPVGSFRYLLGIY